MNFNVKCALSHNADKSCDFAMETKSGVQCKYVIGWYHDLSIEHHSFCFQKKLTRDKLSWRNKMIKKFGPAKI